MKYTWPRPPKACPAKCLEYIPEGTRIIVAGLGILRQRPGTANGIVFITLEDETGTVNVIVWQSLFEHFRRAVISGKLLRVTGRLKCGSGVIHIIAEQIEDISYLLDLLTNPQVEANSKAVSNLFCMYQAKEI